jgi:hypothetical protein
MIERLPNMTPKGKLLDVLCLLFGIDIVPYSINQQLKLCMNLNANGQGLYHGITCRSECCTIA